MEGGMTGWQGILPDDCYLATFYHDGRNGLVTRRVYRESGPVEAYDGQGWWTVCVFTRDQVEQAKEIILASGLESLPDLASGEEIHDTALLAYTWRVDGHTGIFTNHLYPAIMPPVVEQLDEALGKLEEQFEESSHG